MNCKLNYLYEKFPDNPEFAQHLEQIELSIWKTFKDEKFPTFEYEGKRYYSISPKMSKERKKQMKILQSLRDKYNSPNLFLTKKLYPFDYDLITIRMGTIVSSQKELFDVLQKNKPKKPPEEKEAYPSIYEETYEKFLRFNSNTSNPQSSENKNINNQQKNVVYSAIFFNTNELTNKYNQVHPNLYSHHSTIEFKPQTIENLPVGENRNIRIIGRLTTDKVDVLIVDNPLSKNKFPHITLSTAEGVKPFESNSEIEKNQNKIKPLNDIIVGKVGYFDGKNEIVNDEKFDENYNLNKIKSGVEELFDSNPELAQSVYEALGFEQTKELSKEDSEKVDKIFKKYPDLAKLFNNNKELYNSYLESVFPEASQEFKGKLFFHGTKNPIDDGKFKITDRNLAKGLWFTKQLSYAKRIQNYAEEGDNPIVYGVVLNIKNPKHFYNSSGALLVQRPSDFEKEYNRKENDAAVFHHPESSDGKFKNEGGYNQVVVFDKNQVHIIGDENDINKAKEFITNQITQQQKQQAGSLFSEFLDVYLQDYEQVEKILKEENIIQKKCN